MCSMIQMHSCKSASSCGTEIGLNGVLRQMTSMHTFSSGRVHMFSSCRTFIESLYTSRNIEMLLKAVDGGKSADCELNRQSYNETSKRYTFHENKDMHSRT